jgi:hypothetical protein
MNQALEALESQYTLLLSSKGAFLPPAVTQEQQDAFMTQLVKSRKNYWAAIATTLHDDDPQIQKLVSQLNTEQLTLSHQVSQMAKVSEVLDAITKAVEVGSTIITKAMTL